jgi:hypothetical protein
MRAPWFYDNAREPSGWVDLQPHPEDRETLLASMLDVLGDDVEVEVDPSSGYVCLAEHEFDSRYRRPEIFARYESQLREAASKVIGRPVQPFLGVERIYCLDWDQFRDPTWDALARAYESLPEWKGVRLDMRCPYWFGLDDEAPPHLWASVEPPGLQVAGLLTQSAWTRWHDEFLRATEGLPWRSE